MPGDHSPLLEFARQIDATEVLHHDEGKTFWHHADIADARDVLAAQANHGLSFAHDPATTSGPRAPSGSISFRARSSPRRRCVTLRTIPIPPRSSTLSTRYFP